MKDETEQELTSVVCLPSSVLRLGDHAHDVGLLHDEEFIAIELDFGAGPFAEQHAIAGLEVHGDELAVLVAAARSDGDDLTLLRLLLDGIGNDDAALALFLGFNSLDDNPVCRGRNLSFAMITSSPLAERPSC